MLFGVPRILDTNDAIVVSLLFFVFVFVFVLEHFNAEIKIKIKDKNNPENKIKRFFLILQKLPNELRMHIVNEGQFCKNMTLEIVYYKWLLEKQLKLK
jgi:hypothetical protein